MIRLAAAFVLLAGAGAAGSAQRTPPPLAFRIDEGRNINAFVRQGPVAAHLLLRSGTDPRILIGFPAGNSGVALWFAKTAQPVAWALDRPPEPWRTTDRKGRRLNGITATVSIDARTLTFGQGVLSSIRVLRDYELLRTAPPEVSTMPMFGEASPMHGDAVLTWARDRLDGAAGYWLSVSAVGDTVMTDSSVSAGPSGRIRLTIKAATGEVPLTPLAEDALLTGAAGTDARARHALQFLSYREKYLAGSWRFDTYFGRDTLMSLRLLMPVLQPVAVEDGLGAVLARLAPDGQVAHEEDIGEFAVLRNAKEGRGRVATPIYDYAMVDDDFMFPAVVRAWLLDRGRDRASAFLGGRIGGVRRGDLLARNFAWVVKRTAAFAAAPGHERLVAIKDGRLTGQWRDSEEGLGRGVYAYDVNAVWVPAALAAIADLAPLIDRYGTPAERAAISRAAAQARIWRERAPGLFALTLPNTRARAAVADYARAVGVSDAPALAALGDAPLAFNALSLDARGRPVPVIHSDDGFALLFTDPDPAALDRSVAAIARPFPAGLMTDVGLLVANPAYAPAETRARFGANAYHGTVVWSWQQAILAAGLDRQLARRDLPAATRAALVALRSRLWRAIDAAGEVRTSELWSWTYADGRYRVAPFGASSGDADESNAAQLWSTVFLALHPPAR
ncbi:lipoprotein [Sphingomonas cynarae]|uniref:Lipoprotein n=1 Tax=Sphingomonas cynarae TaxID=930197 RepID=A0ABP7EP93_9SPHN